ncbi:MAG: MoaD/ThiS family protein [Planctomycetota bacterium]
MPTIECTSQLTRHVDCPSESVDGRTLRESLTHFFRLHPKVQGYVLDDQGAVRKHVAIFVDNQLLHDRLDLDVPVQETSSIFVMQALSGG